jgi:hypothetical protein
MNDTKGMYLYDIIKLYSTILNIPILKNYPIKNTAFNLFHFQNYLHSFIKISCKHSEV